jgi:cytidylate kinase
MAMGDLKYTVIALDGPAGSGKSTIARSLSQHLCYTLLDTGALYRGLALGLLRLGVDPEIEGIDRELLHKIDIKLELGDQRMDVLIEGVVQDEILRDEYIGAAASKFASLAEVRDFLLDLQRSAAQKGPIVAEGRDMGTVVFPEAHAKFFLTASLEERFRRRLEQLQSRGESPDPREVYWEMEERDRRDSQRLIAPLTPAQDSITINTDGVGPDEVLKLILSNLRSLS